MTLTLSPLLTEWLAAHNRHDSEAFIRCFTDDATLRDEGKVYHGLPAIKAWFEDASRRYRMTLDVTEITEVAGEIVLAGEISGDLDGGPVALRYILGTEDDKIVALRIRP